MKYVISIVAIMFGFAIMGMLLFGNSSQDFLNFGRAFISTIALTIGAIDDGIWLNTDGSLLAAFLTFYFLFVMFIILTVFASIYIDFYRQATMELGTDGARPEISMIELLI
jgi:hypothetical protein